MPAGKIQTGVRFTADMLSKITYIAKKNHRSFNGQMEYLAQKCIDDYEVENGEIQNVDLEIKNDTEK